MRLHEFRKRFQKLGVDACLLTAQDPNFHYFVQKQVNDGALIIPKTGKPYLLLTPLEDIYVEGFRIMRVRDFYQTLSDIVKKHDIKVMGVNENALYARSYNRIKKHVKHTLTLFDELNKLRIIKTPEEIRLLRTACRITCKIMNQLMQELEAGKFRTEAQVKSWLKIKTFESGNELSFEPIVASGKDAAIPHYFGNKRLAKGFLIIDYGIRHKGYCADMTRTPYLGRPSQQEKEIYNKVLKCQTGSIRFIEERYKKRVEGIQAYDHARQLLGDDEQYFIHGLGHGIGLKVHELPTLSERPGEVLRKGSVFTVEPGYYNDKGIRIEDDIYLGKRLEVLTSNTPKKLKIIS